MTKPELIELLKRAIRHGREDAIEELADVLMPEAKEPEPVAEPKPAKKSK